MLIWTSRYLPFAISSDDMSQSHAHATATSLTIGLELQSKETVHGGTLTKANDAFPNLISQRRSTLAVIQSR